MMGINQVSKVEAKEIIKKLADEKYFIAEIDGENIDTLEKYMREIICAFHFPKGMFKNLDSFDSYNDWMRDLNWLGDYAGYALFIINEKEMLKKHQEIKNTIFELFIDTIIPFWKDEVVDVVVGGKPKEFDVFIVK